MMQDHHGAVTAEITQGGVAVLVALGGPLEVLGAAAAIDLGLRPVRVRAADEGCAEIRARGPRVVVAPSALTEEERGSLAQAARWAGAELVLLGRVVDRDGIAHAMARAVALATVDGLPETVRGA